MVRCPSPGSRLLQWILGNLLRRLLLPPAIQRWSLTSLQLAESHLTGIRDETFFILYSWA